MSIGGKQDIQKDGLTYDIETIDMTANEIEQKARIAIPNMIESSSIAQTDEYSGNDIRLLQRSAWSMGYVAAQQDHEADRDKFAVELLDWLIEHHYIDGFLFETTQDILELFKNREK